MDEIQKVNEKFTVQQFIDAVKGSRGIKETIRQRLNCSRMTVDNYLNRYATAMQAYKSEIELIGDVAENVIINSIRDGNVETAKWYAVKKLRDRGYGEGPSGREDDPFHIVTRKVIEGPEDVR